MPAKIIKNYFVNPQNRFDYSRSVFPYERTHSTNLLTGAIVPVGYINCLPGTTVPNKFGFVLQSAPLLGPSLDNVYIDIISVWIPTRLVMADFNEWLGDNDTYAWTLGNNVHYPKITKLGFKTESVIPSGYKFVSNTYHAEHYLAPHFGLRFFPGSGATAISADQVVIDSSDTLIKQTRLATGINVIPSRMYDLVWNRLFRNENIQNPVLFSKQSGTDLSLDVSNYQVGLGQIRYANRLKNMFNMARLGPSIQTVDILNGISSPVLTGVAHSISGSSMHFVKTDNTSVASASLGTNTAGNLAFLSDSSYGSANSAVPNNLWAQLSGLTVNSLYYSIMLQKYMNKASTGRRPVEFYKTMFGISRSDAAYDDPELLSQKRFKVNISRVVSTASADDAQGTNQGLGTQGAFSITSVGGILYPEFTATEYGMVQIYAVIRTQESISSGIDRYLTDHELLSTYLPVFDHIGEDYVELNELANNFSGTPFGYQEAWYNYRYQMNSSVGIFTHGESMDYMTFARDFGYGGSPFTINSNYIMQSPIEFDRILQLPVFYGDPALTTSDSMGELYQSDRYQWVIQFALAGDLVQTMSKDSEPLLFGNKI